MRWIDDFGDELTMAIATRDWEEAVEQVEKGDSAVCLVRLVRTSADQVR